MKHLYLIILVGFMGSCIPKFYGLANYATESSYVPKPIYQDTTVTASYLTGSYHYSQGSYKTNSILNLNTEYKSQFGNLEWAKSTVRKNTFYSYGVNTYGGLIDTRSVEDDKNTTILVSGNKGFYGGGIFVAFGPHFSTYKWTGYNFFSVKSKNEHRSKDGFNSHFSAYKWHNFFGIKSSLLYEKGDFSEFRKLHEIHRKDKNVSSQYNYNSNLTPNDFSVNISLTFDAIRKLDLDSSFGFHLSYGTGNQIRAMGGALFYTYKNTSVIVSSNQTKYGESYLGISLSYMIGSKLKK